MQMRSLLPIGVAAFLGTAAIVACSSSTTATFDVPGVSATYAFTVPSYWTDTSCSGDEYIVVDVSYCSSCTDTAYAYCDGDSYSYCGCDAPSGGDWTVGTEPDGDDASASSEGGSEASSSEGGSEASSSEAGSEASSEEAGSSEAGAEAGSEEAGSSEAGGD